MNFSLIDAASLVLAVVSYGVLLVLPGALLAALFGAIGFREADPDTRRLIAIVVGLALLPAVDSLTTRFAGLDAALAVNLILAMGAAGLAGRHRQRLALSRLSIALLLAWFAILAIEWVDFDFGGGLYQSFTVVDMVKHAATTQTIHDTGAPPRDPFFFRPERVSYYYFFYTLAALSERLCFGLIDARAAVGGLAFWTGVGVYAVARLVIIRAGLVLLPDAARRLQLLLVLLLAAGGLDIVFVLRMALLQNYWLPDPTWWNDEVANWLEAVIWVPHHMTALIASLVGFTALADAVARPDSKATAPVAVAALCFASALGLSVWITLVSVATVGLWLVLLVFERRWRAAAIVGLAGLAAVLIAAPALLDLRAGRSGAVPIELAIRSFSPVDAVFKGEPLRAIARFLALPLNYFAEVGVLFSGALLFWRANKVAEVHRNELARLLTLSAGAGLVLGSVLRSTLFDNNDLGWRVLMFPQMAALVWTASILLQREAGTVLRTMRLWRLFPPLPLTLLFLGYGTTLYALVSLRAHAAMPLQEDARLFVTHPAGDRAQRAAYVWANQHLPQTMVLQHNPNFGKRVVNFGLYSRNPVGVSDVYGSLFGASTLAVEERLRAIMPVFAESLPNAEIARRAHANGIDAFVVSADDPVWAVRDSFVWRAQPAFESALVRIIPVWALCTPPTSCASEPKALF